MRSALARAARRWLRGGRVGVWYHPSYRLPLSGVLASTGMSARRADDALTWLLDSGNVDAPRTAPLASWLDLGAVHTSGWLEQLDQPGDLARILGVEDGRALPATELLETWRRAAGGTIEAARWALASGRPAANLLGGFHHAFPDRGFGFCPINDLAIAVARLRREGFHGRVVVVDLDAHPPDGTAACLADDESVSIGSVGVASEWGVGDRALDLRVPAGSGDAPYLRAVDELLARLPEPELALYVAGADPLAGDRFGGLACTEAGLRERDRRVLRWVGGAPCVVVPGGGYTADAWRVLAGTVAELAGARRPIAPGYDPVFRRTLDISRTLDLEVLRGDGAGFELTEADVLGDLARDPASERRFLGFYTRHGLEYAFERYGLLPALRRMGFQDLQLELQPDADPARLRISAAVGPTREVLVDLALSVRSFGSWRVLYVEWLELRDPRVTFRSDRPKLPGQGAPGLGLSAEIGHMLLRAAERIGLDGVGLVPAWFHVAWMARKEFVGLDPEAQGRFEALVTCLSDVPLLEATARLAVDGLPTPDGPFKWRPFEMVRPARDGLREALAADAPKVAEAKARWLAAFQAGASAAQEL